MRREEVALVTRAPRPSGGPSGDAVSLSAYMTDGIDWLSFFFFLFISSSSARLPGT